MIIIVFFTIKKRDIHPDSKAVVLKDSDHPPTSNLGGVSILNSPEGKARVVLLHADTKDLLEGTYFYGVSVVHRNDSALVYTLLKGCFTVNLDIRQGIIPIEPTTTTSANYYYSSDNNDYSSANYNDSSSNNYYSRSNNYYSSVQQLRHTAPTTTTAAPTTTTAAPTTTTAAPTTTTAAPTTTTAAPTTTTAAPTTTTAAPTTTTAASNYYYSSAIKFLFG